jgi:hypothetical protein
MTKRTPRTPQWTIENTEDLRAYLYDFMEIVDELENEFVTRDGNRRRRANAAKVYDCLAHMVWNLEMFLTFAETHEHPNGSLGFSIGHVLTLARSHKFFRMGHETTMEDLQELEKIGPVVSKEMMYDMTANVQRILGLRGAGEVLSSDDPSPDT